MNGKGSTSPTRSNSQLVQRSQPSQPGQGHVSKMDESKTSNSYSKFPKVLNKDADEIVKDFHKVSLKEAVVHWEEEEEFGEENGLEDEKEAKTSHGSGKGSLARRPPGQGDHGTRHFNLGKPGQFTDPKCYINGLLWVRGVRTVHVSGPNQQRRVFWQQPGPSQDNSSQLGTNLPMDESK